MKLRKPFEMIHFIRLSLIAIFLLSIFLHLNGKAVETFYKYDNNSIPRGDSITSCFAKPQQSDANLTGIYGPENLLVSNQYDELNRMDSSTVAGNITQGFVYDASGNLTQYTKPNGFAWKSTFSGAGLLKTTSDPLGNASSYAYDKRALPLSVNETENSGRSLNHTVSYNALGNVSSSDDSLQRKWQHHYDGATQLPQNRVDPENGAVAYSYDGLNRFNKETRYISYKGNSVPAATRYEYDLNNNMTSVKDDNANETVYQYDDKDRLTRTIYPDGRSESYTYDKNDRLLSRTDANGTAVTNVYDAAGRLTSRSIAPAAGVEGPTQEQFSYDRLNRIVRAENENAVTAFVYDNAGRLLKETQQGKNGGAIISTNNVNLDYDNNGNKTSLTYPSGKALSITPDALDRIASIQSAGNPVAGYTYEGQDKVKIKTLGSGLKLEAEFDDGKRPTGFKYANAVTSKEIIGQTATWNKVDLQTAMTRTDASKLSKNFAYDSAYRLRNAVAAQDETAYEIDGADNIKQVKETKKGVAQTATHEVNNRNQVITLDNRTLTYDANGNLTKMTDGGTITNYIYDYKNQLLRVEGSGTRVEFVYDALGRRVEKKAVYSSSSDVTRYVYDGHQVIEERNSANVLKARYAYGNGIDEPVEIERANTAGTMQSYLPMQDTNGNVIGIADGTGKLIEKVHYDSYGQPTFIYDQEPPQVDQVRVTDGKVRIRFSEAVNEVTAKDAIALKEGANEVSGSFVFEEEGKLVVFVPGSALATNTQYALEISTDLEDVSGNKLANAFSQSFTYAGSDLMVYDRVAPQVESAKFVDGKFSVEFTEEIDLASVASAIDLTYTTGTIAGTSTLEDAKTILFTPSSSLYNSTEYTLAVKPAVMDLSGKALSAYSVKFTYTSKDLLIYQKPDPSEHQESVIGNSTLFQGREFDPETGLYYFRARYLHPKLGRFLQGDPKGYVDSMNPYQAMGNNPVNFSDPMGTTRITKHGGVNILGDYMNDVEYTSDTPWYKKTWDVIADTAGNTISSMLMLDTIADTAIVAGDSSYSVKQRLTAGLAGTGVVVADTIGGEITGKVAVKVLKTKPVQWLAKKILGSKWGEKAVDVLTQDVTKLFKKKATPGDTFYRYVGEKEADAIRRTGRIPNTKADGERKLVYFTDRKYTTAGRAKTYNQLPNKPKYGVVIDSNNVPNRTPFTRIDPNASPLWGKGGGVEGTTTDSIPVDPLLMFILKGGNK